MKSLIVGDDYGAIFGLDAGKGQHMYYRGGETWEAVDGARNMVRESKSTTDNAIKYINRPSVVMGVPK